MKNCEIQLEYVHECSYRREEEKEILETRYRAALSYDFSEKKETQKRLNSIFISVQYAQKIRDRTIFYVYSTGLSIEQRLGTVIDKFSRRATRKYSPIHRFHELQSKVNTLSFRI